MAAWFKRAFLELIAILFLSVPVITCLLVVVAWLFALALVIFFPAPVERDRLVLSEHSPDGERIAEIHTVVTGMWMGPDYLYVAIDGYRIYSRVYECEDTTGYRLEWWDSTHLRIYYSQCDVGPRTYEVWRSNNRVREQLDRFYDVKVRYIYAGYVAKY